MTELKEQINAKLIEIEELLLNASCDGEQLAECAEVWEDINSTLNTLGQAVEYYVD